MPRSWSVVPVLFALVVFGADSLSRPGRFVEQAGHAAGDPPLVADWRGTRGATWWAPKRRSSAAGREASPVSYLMAPISRALSFRPELLFSLKGGRTQTGSALLDIELAYLEIPLLAKFSFSRRRFRPVIFAGPAPSLQIGCDVQFIAADQASRSTCGEGSFSLFRTFDFGIVAGGGVEVRWPQSALALEARYTAGLRSILDESDVRNRAYGLVLALTF